jgi:hypothetical protein
MTSSRNFIKVQTNTAIALQNNTSTVPPVTYSNSGVANVWKFNFKVLKGLGHRSVIHGEGLQCPHAAAGA